jgi:serine/threonine protein kinase
LDHPNIVPLLGVTSIPLQLISEWMTGGSLTEYIKKNPNADRLGLVSAPPVVLIPHSLPLLAI